MGLGGPLLGGGDATEEEAGAGGDEVVAARRGEGECLFAVAGGVGEDAQGPTQGPPTEECLGAGTLGGGVPGDREEAAEPGAALVQVTANGPEEPESTGEADAGGGIGPLEPGQRGAEVVDLGFQLRGPGCLIGTHQVRFGPLGELKHVPGVASPDLVRFAADLQPVERELPERLEHPEPWFALRSLFGAEQTRVDERGELVEHGGGGDGSRETGVAS